MDTTITTTAEHPGARLRAVLKTHGKTIADVARALGVTHQSIEQVVAGRKSWTLDWAHRVATAMELDPAEIDPRLAPKRGRKKSRKNSSEGA